MSVKSRPSHSPPDLSDSDRPTRRQRLEDASVPDESPPTRHEEFFKEDGDCFLRAENVIFKVSSSLVSLANFGLKLRLEIHRYHLLRGGASVFKDMFLLPSGGNASQGSGEDDPIVLAGDTAERVNGFFTVAYVEILDFQIADMCAHNVPLLIHCAYFAHKYNITPLLHASLRAVVQLAETKLILNLNSPVAASILALRSLCDADGEETSDSTSEDDIESAVEWGWISELNTERTFEDLATAMDFGEDHALPDLVARSAALYLQKLSVAVDNVSSTEPRFPFDDHDFLRTSHRLRIMSGAWSLEQLWTRLTSEVPPFPSEVVCTQSFPRNHKTVCIPQWEKDWRSALGSEAVGKVSCGDMPKKLLTFKNELQPAFEAGCSKSAFNGVNPVTTLRNRFELSSHFMDP